MGFINFSGHKVRAKDISDGTKNGLLNIIYPVGSIYISMTNTSPSTLFGGTWERIKGCVLAGIDESDTDTNTKTSFNQTSGTKIGSKESEKHAHQIKSQSGSYPGSGWNDKGYMRSNADNYTLNNWSNCEWAKDVNGDYMTGDAKNIQPTMLVYIWRRTG